VNIMGFMAVCAGVLCFLLALNWYFVLRRKVAYIGWRRRAALVALAFPSSALCGELVLTATAYFYPLNQTSESGLGSNAWAVLWVAVAILTFCGPIVVMISKGTPRISSIVWSIVAFGFFFVTGFIFMNSFH